MLPGFLSFLPGGSLVAVNRAGCLLLGGISSNSVCLCMQDVEVVYRGVETGQVEAVFKAATPEYRARPYSTGLEGSAIGGVVWAVHTFGIVHVRC